MYIDTSVNRKGNLKKNLWVFVKTGMEKVTKTFLKQVVAMTKSILEIMLQASRKTYGDERNRVLMSEY